MPDELRLLVTGRDGQVARALAERATGSSIVVTHLARPDLDLSKVDGLAAVVRDAIDRARPDAIVSAAAYTAVDLAEDDAATARAVNAEAPGEIARAAGAAGLPILHLSTDYVFDGTLDRPYREDDPVAPLGVYGATKEAGERAVRDATSDHVILRTAWVVSPFGRNFVKTMLKLADTRDELSVVDDQRGCPTSAHDIAKAIVLVAGALNRGGPFGTFHMAAAGETTWAGLARAVFEESRALGGPTAHVTGIATHEYPTPARRPANSRLDCARLRTAFDVTMPPWRQSCAAIVRRLLSGDGAAPRPELALGKETA